MRFGLLFIVLFSLVSCLEQKGNLPIIFVDPVFKLDKRAPTEDKPQSKIWFSNETWWALLPTKFGPSLWKRTGKGWEEDRHFGRALIGQPGKADIYEENSDAMAVLVRECELKILRLSYLRLESRYIPEIMASLHIPEDCSSIETATITKDSQGIWWVASDMNNYILVWSSPDGKVWTEPQVLAKNINADDICTVTKLPGKVSVIWSNQDDEAIMEAIHVDGNPRNQWSNPEIVEKGNKAADDHLHTTTLEDGTLILVTKNSIDQIDKPQLVLRVRDTLGHWNNIPYCNLTFTEMPTRPVVNHTYSGTIIEVHSVRNVKPVPDYHISFSVIDLIEGHWRAKEKLVVKSRNKSTVNNVTVSKRAFPKGMPWIVLFSDEESNVYELDLKKSIPSLCSYQSYYIRH